MYKFMASIASNGFGVWGVFTSGLGTFEGSSSTLQSLRDDCKSLLQDLGLDDDAGRGCRP